MAADTTSRLERTVTFRDSDFVWTVWFIRADSLAVFGAAVSAVAMVHGSWTWFIALFLVPDVSMSGYLFGSRAGAVAYNTGHMFAWPLALLAMGIVGHGAITTTAALSWIAHIAFDHALGYGAKLPGGFEQTTLGPIGRSRRQRQAVDVASRRSESQNG